MKATHFLTIAAVVSALFIAGCDGSAAPEAELEAMTRKVAKKFQEVPQLSTADLAAWLADPERMPPQLLDAREPEEFAVSRRVPDKYSPTSSPNAESRRSPEHPPPAWMPARSPSIKTTACPLISRSG